MRNPPEVVYMHARACTCTNVCVCVWFDIFFVFLVGNFSSDELNWDQEEAFGTD